MNSQSSPATPLYLVATLQAVKGAQTQLLNALQTLVPRSKQEPGCIRYDLHVDRADSTVLIVYEIWRDQTALDEHAASGHFQQFLTTAEPLLAAPLNVRVLDLVQ